MAGIATAAPATVASQGSSFAQIIGSLVSGSVAVVQAVRQPTGIYRPAVAGQATGGTQGAAQPQAQNTPTWTYYAFGAAAALLVTASVLMARRK